MHPVQPSQQTAARVLGGASYLHAFEADQLAALARLGLSAQASSYGVGFFFLAIGSSIFAGLWIRSGYVPRALAWLGLVASILLGAGSFLWLLLPGPGSRLYPWYMVPMFLFELGMGLLLLAKGLKEPS